MSTTVQTYVLLGISYPVDKHEKDLDRMTELSDSPYQPSRPFSDLTCVYDGMSGEYLFIGHVLSRSGATEGFVEPVTIPDGVNRNTLIAGIFEQFPPAEGTNREDYVDGWHVITHYR